MREVRLDEDANERAAVRQDYSQELRQSLRLQFIDADEVLGDHLDRFPAVVREGLHISQIILAIGDHVVVEAAQGAEEHLFVGVKDGLRVANLPQAFQVLDLLEVIVELLDLHALVVQLHTIAGSSQLRL